MMSQDHVVGICLHEQTQAYQNKFGTYVKSLYKTYIEYGNVFLHNTDVLFNTFIGTTYSPSAIESIISLEFVERLVDRVVSIKTNIKNSKLHMRKDLKN